MTRKKKAAPAPAAQAIVRLDFDTAPGFELAQRRATALALASAVPEAFRGPPGSPGHANTMLALELAHRLGFSPLMVMQNLSIIKGRPGWSGQFYIALCQSSGRYKDHRWEWTGTRGKDDWGARMIATRLSDGRECVGNWVTIALVKAEGWWSNVDSRGIERSKWQTMPEQMLVYRSAAFWARQWDPGATIGIPPVEEVEDIREEPRLLPPPPPLVPPAAPAPEPGVATTNGSTPRTATELEAPAPAPEPESAPAGQEQAGLPGIGGPPTGEPTKSANSSELDAAIKLIQEGKLKEAIRAISKLSPGEQKVAAALYNEAYDRKQARG